MPNQFIKIIIAALLFCFSHSLWANGIESEIRSLEAQLIYEDAVKQVVDGKYDKAVRRLDWIVSAYPETEYMPLATDKREEVAILLHQPKPISNMSRAGLVGFGTFYTTWLGVGTLILLDVEDPSLYGLASIAGPVGGLLGSLSLTRESELSDGQASLVTLGGTWGIWQAVGAASLADADEKLTVGASMVGGALGLALASGIVSGRDIGPGDATLINFGGIWGTWFSICGAMAARDRSSDSSKFVLGSAMMGGNIGLSTMAAWSTRLNMSRARARLINIGGIVGTLYGLGTSILLDIEPEDRSFWLLMGIGGMVGLTAGSYFTRNYDTPESYFTKSGVGMLNLELAEKRWNLSLPAITVSPVGGGNSRIPDIELWTSLVQVRF
ncbi:hypothetical protein C6502_06400 [Candidatus Poribacteria bacterium]|nr:MAG: hypothetical protein C6502_06400 [Candidatus Poribacteria bacterium]